MSSNEPQIELIEFQNPDNQLYIPRICWPSDDRNELIQLLKDKFSVHGLIHSVNVDKSTSNGQGFDEILATGPSSWYAYVNFYSSVAAKQAGLFLHNNLLIEGALCRVQAAKERKQTDLPLAIHKCMELANYYLGFNGWSSAVIYSNLETSEVIGQVCSEMYAIGMRLTFPSSDGNDISVEGVGLSSAEYDIPSPTNGHFEKKANAIAYARKSARSAALRNAFDKLILVVVSNKKVTVRVNTTKADPFYFNPLWDEENPVAVNVMDYSEDQTEEGVKDDFTV